MLELQFIRRCLSGLAALERRSMVFEVLETLESKRLELEGYMERMARGHPGEPASLVQALLASLSKTTRSINPRVLFRDIEELRSGLEAAFLTGTEKHSSIAPLFRAIEGFAEQYSTYVAHQSSAHALPLLQSSRRLHEELVRTQGLLRYLVDNVSLAGEPREGEAVLTLTLWSVGEAHDFAEKLRALNDIYAELCSLLRVSQTAFPLRIGKIESGSLWARVFGESRAIRLIWEFLEAAVRFLHRNYTKEGRIESIPSKVESLDAILQLKRRLQEEGVPVEQLQEELSKGAYYLAKNLTTLLGDQSKVEVNGKEYLVGEQDLPERLAAPRVMRLAEHPSTATPSEPPKLEGPK